MLEIGPETRAIRETWATRMSAERKGVGLDAGVEEADFERMIHDRTGIANELIETLCRNDPLPV